MIYYVFGLNWGHLISSKKFSNVQEALNDCHKERCLLVVVLNVEYPSIYIMFPHALIIWLHLYLMIFFLHIILMVVLMHAICLRQFSVFLDQSLHHLVVVLEHRPVKGRLLWLVLLVEQGSLQATFIHIKASKYEAKYINVSRCADIV